MFGRLQDATLYIHFRGLLPPDRILPVQNLLYVQVSLPNFQPMSMVVGLGPGHITRLGPSSRPQKGAEPQFSGHFYCGQMAGCIKMPLGVEVGLSPDHFVLDGVQALSPRRGGAPPIFGSCLLLPNGFMDQDATWYEVGLVPDDIGLDGDPAPLHEREQPPTQFWPMSIVAERLDGSRCHLVRR